MVPEMEIQANVDYRIKDLRDSARQLAIARDLREEPERQPRRRRWFRVAMPQLRRRPT